MCASALFTGLTPRECREIASCAHARTFARDELLFMQGQPVRSLVLIQSGSVSLTQLSASGNEVILWMNGSGDAMGVHADSPSCSHTCSGRAMEQCKALVWEYTRLQMLVAEYPQLRKNISQILAGRLQELEERFREIATEKVAKRLALALSRLPQASRQKDPGGRGSFSLPGRAGSTDRHNTLHDKPHTFEVVGVGGSNSAPRGSSGSRSRASGMRRMRRGLDFVPSDEMPHPVLTECGIIFVSIGMQGPTFKKRSTPDRNDPGWTCFLQRGCEWSRTELLTQFT